METAEYLNVFEKEENHFYYRALRELVFSLIEKYSPARDGRILDAGCGTGFLAKQLKQERPLEAIDISPLACSLTEKRGVAVRQASVTEIPYAKETFDLVLSADVLYHLGVENDERALSEMARILKPNGILILRVPAFSSLYGEHDRHVHTRERYSKKTLKDKLSCAGFEIEKLSYVGLPLYPAAVLKRILFNKKAPSTCSGVRNLPDFLNRMFYQILSWENRALLEWDIPLGIGLVAVAKKRYSFANLEK